MRDGRSEGNLIGNGDNGLPYLITQFILEGDAIDTECLPVERWWTETFVSQMPLKDVFHCMSSGLGLVFRRWQDSAHKILDTASGYDVMNRADLWCLDATAFIELCAAAGATFVSSRWDNLVWLPNYCSPLHWDQILDRIWLEEPKKCDFAAGRICDGTVTKHFPRWLLREHLIKKNEIFPAFPALFKQTSDASERVLQ